MRTINIEILNPKADKLLKDLEDQNLVKINKPTKVCEESDFVYGQKNIEYTAIIKQEGKWWIGWIEEVTGVNCQEKTYDKLIESLKITLKEALEFNRQDAIAAAGNHYKEHRIAITL
jgi:predicted RNase H-like HicB family nuclease